MAEEKKVPIESLVSSHEKELLDIHSNNINLFTSQIEEIKDSGEFVPPILIHNLRNVQLEINSIYNKYGQKEPFSVTKPDLNVEKELSDQEEELLLIHTINLKHAQVEKDRLDDGGYDFSAAQAVIEESQREINRIVQ